MGKTKSSLEQRSMRYLLTSLLALVALQHPLSAATVAALIEQYFPRVSGKVAIPGHSFSYLLESVREENPALFATILCE